MVRAFPFLVDPRYIGGMCSARLSEINRLLKSFAILGGYLISTFCLFSGGNLRVNRVTVSYLEPLAC